MVARNKSAKRVHSRFRSALFSFAETMMMRHLRFIEAENDAVLLI